MLHGKGSSQGHQAVHAHTSRKETREAFVDLSGPKVVESLGRKRYTIIVRDDFSRYTWVYLSATSRTLRNCSRSSSGILGKTLSLPRW